MYENKKPTKPKRIARINLAGQAAFTAEIHEEGTHGFTVVRHPKTGRNELSQAREWFPFKSAMCTCQEIRL